MTTLYARLRPWLAVLCEAGAGLALWVALSSALLPAGTTTRKLVEMQSWGLLLGALLVAGGLALFWPQPAGANPWRRRSLLAMALAVAGSVALAVLQLRPQPVPGLALPLAVLTCASALATIACLAMLEGDQAGLRLPTRLALALLGGAALLFALIALTWPGPGLAAGPVPSLALLVLVAGALLIAGWQAQGGLWPWSRWPRRWRVLALLAGLPLLLAALLYVQPDWASTLWPLVALAVLAGTVVERAQAR
jgi:hypothetical protein